MRDLASREALLHAQCPESPELLCDLALHQLLVSLRDDVGGVVEKQDRPAEALDGLLLLHGRDEQGLELRIKPDVAPHEGQRVDRLMKRDPFVVTIVGVFRVHSPGFVKGGFRTEDPPEFRVEVNGLRNRPVFGKVVIGRGLGVFPHVCIPLPGDLVCIVLGDIDQLCRYGLHGVPPFPGFNGAPLFCYKCKEKRRNEQYE